LRLERHVVIRDGDGEVLGHFVVVDHAADRKPALVFAAQRPFGAPHASGNCSQLFLGSVDQLASFGCAFLGEQRIAADDEALVRIVGSCDLSQVALVEWRELDRARLDEPPDRRRPQGGDPVEPGRLDGLLKARLRDHAAIADQHDALKRERLLELVDLARQRRRIAGIACEHFDRNRAAVGRAQQTEYDLQLAGLAVAAVASSSQVRPSK
jgi:hypothetical protein